MKRMLDEPLFLIFVVLPLVPLAILLGGPIVYVGLPIATLFVVMMAFMHILTTGINFSVDVARAIRAPFKSRLLAAFGDACLNCALLMLYRANARTEDISEILSSNHWVIAILAVSLGMSWGLGGTPGKLAVGCRIVDARTGNFPSLWKCVLRYIGSSLSLALFGIGYLWMLWDDNQQTLHDKVAGTLVVYAIEEVIALNVETSRSPASPKQRAVNYPAPKAREFGRR